MAQETRNVDYESMVEKYMNEWDGCNLREFCFSEKVNIYRMLKTMKKMGVKKEPLPHGLKPLEFSEMQESDDADGGKAYVDDGCVHNVKLTCGRDVQVVIPTVSSRRCRSSMPGNLRSRKRLTKSVSVRWMKNIGFARPHLRAVFANLKMLTIVRSALMNSLNVYQYIVYCLKTIRSYKGDLADLLANKWKPADTELMPVLA